MDSNGRILRPRHLFPEVSAAGIQGRRALLRTTRGLRQFVGHVPAWSLGAGAAVAGLMLATLLFFLEEQSVTAAAPAEPPPAAASVPAVPPPETVREPAAPDGGPQLKVFVDHTRLPAAWNPELSATVRSRAPILHASNSVSTADDGWKAASPPARQSLARWQPPDEAPPPHQIVSSPGAASWNAVQKRRSMGLTVEKSLPFSVGRGEAAEYEIRLTNHSHDVIEHVTLRERILAVHELLDVSPGGVRIDDEIVWSVDALTAGETATFQIRLLSQDPSGIRTETRVFPISRVGAMVRVQPKPAPVTPQPAPIVRETPKRPRLQLAYTPVQALTEGDTLSMHFTVTNVGDAPAEDVTLFVRLSGELQHRYGEYVKHHIRRLEPGQSRRALFQARAERNGQAHLGASLTRQGTEEERRELSILIQPGRPEVPQPVLPSSEETAVRPEFLPPTPFLRTAQR